MSNYLDSRLIWIDLEMTGLNVHKDKIIEISCVITGPNLNVESDILSMPIYQNDTVLNKMEDVVVKMHQKSGLLKEVKKSNIMLRDAEDAVIQFLVKNNIKEKSCPLAGNSVHVDRMFLVLHMPRLVEFFHYRIVDVSSIKELCRRWYPSVKYVGDIHTHRAMEDIKSSIEELKFYMNTIFKKQTYENLHKRSLM